jgi:hypothetical protein
MRQHVGLREVTRRTEAVLSLRGRCTACGGTRVEQPKQVLAEDEAQYQHDERPTES